VLQTGRDGGKIVRGALIRRLHRQPPISPRSRREANWQRRGEKREVWGPSPLAVQPVRTLSAREANVRFPCRSRKCTAVDWSGDAA